MDEADAIVVGSGAAGGWAAKTLAEQGARVLVLEAGPLIAGDFRVDRAEHTGDRQPVQSRCSAYEQLNSHLFVDDLDNPYQTPDGLPYNWFRGRQAGGRLLLWAGVCLRLSDREFSGADTGRAWPLRHHHLARYYAGVESFMEVTGGGERSPSLSPPAPGRRRPPTEDEMRLGAAISERWPERQVLSSRTATAEAGSVLSAAMHTGRARLRSDAVVSHIELDDTGRRAEGVVFVDRRTGRSHRARAQVVLLCASAIESVRILLNTRTRHHPDGLGNEHDQVGRYFLDHVAGAAVSGIAGEGGSPLPGGEPGFVPVCHIPNFRSTQDSDFAGGYGVTVFAPSVLPRSEGSAAWARAAGDSRPFRMWATGEVIPRWDNRITLAHDKDAWGLPQAHVRMAYGVNEKAMVADQVTEMVRMAETAGFDPAHVDDQALPPGSSVHELGGAAMGEDPRTSVVDPRNRLWQVPNVIVADGACFTTAGWQQPTLTIMALAARAADELAGVARRGNPERVAR